MISSSAKLLAVLLSSALCCTTVVHAKSEPLRLKSSSVWHVDYAEERCRLARTFGVAKEEVVLLLDQFGPGEYFRLTLGGLPVRTLKPNGEAAVQFGPAEESQSLYFLNGNLGKGKPALIFSSGMRIAGPSAAEKLASANAKSELGFEYAPIDPKRAAAVRYLEIGKPFRRSVILETGSMKGPLAALDKCNEELMTHWGIDVGKHKTLIRPPIPRSSPGNWIVSSDYPSKMLQEGQPSLVEFRLNIGENGLPTACHIQMTTRPKEFDEAVCKALMRRAKFEPALDADAKPLASYWRSKVYFRLPG